MNPQQERAWLTPPDDPPTEEEIGDKEYWEELAWEKKRDKEND